MRSAAAAAVMLLVGCQAGVSRQAASVVERSQEALRKCQYDEANALIDANLASAAPADRALLLLGRGMIQERRGDLPGGLAAYEEALLSEPMPVQAPLLLGVAQVRNRQFAEGHKHLNAYLGSMVKRGRFPAWHAIAADAVALGELGRAGDAHKLLTDAIEALDYSDALLQDLQNLAASSQGAADGGGRFWRLAFGTGPAAGALDTDFGPSPLRRVAPRYPMRAARDRIQGKVLLVVSISAQGAVMDAKILQSEPPGVFDDVALKAVQQWTFRPASRNCAPVDARGVQRIIFHMAR